MSEAAFGVESALEDPFEQFAAWFAEADGTARDLDAVALATASLSGRPSLRMVLLRERSPNGYGFYTSYDSRKAHELKSNPHAALLWFNEALHRQVRIEGTVSVMDPTRSDTYFAARPRAHQISAISSPQSHELASRGELEQRVAEVTASFADQPISRPSTWGGYWLSPTRFEFWQQRSDRLHDRVAYEAPTPGHWSKVRLAP